MELKIPINKISINNLIPKQLLLGEMLVFFFAVVSFLPYIKSSPFGSDVQPHFLLASPVMLIFLKRLVEPILLYGLTMICAGMIFLDLGTVELVGLAYLFVTVVMVSKFTDEEKLVLRVGIRCAILVCALGVFSDFVIGNHLLDRLIANRRASELGFRGACSFASEPSFLGFTGLAAFVTLSRMPGKKNLLFDVVCPAFVLLSSGSLAAIGPAMVLVLVTNLKSATKLLVALGIVAVASLIAIFCFPESRLVQAALQLIESPAFLVENSSGANRVFRGVGPTYFSFVDGLVPHPVSELDRIYEKMRFLDKQVEVKRVSNLSGYLFFIFGFFSIPVVFAYFYKIRHFNYRNKLGVVVTIMIFSFSLLTISTPYLHIMLGALLWDIKEEETISASRRAGALIGRMGQAKASFE